MKYFIHPLIEKRRSIFSFSDKAVEQEKLNLLFEAAGKAPSSFNAQPWGFIYATKNDPVDFFRMSELLKKGNKPWALSAPVLILTLAEVYNEERKEENNYAFHDLGIATGNFFLQATELGLFVHPMGGYDKDKAKLNLNIPSRFEPGAMLALGYPGSDENLTADQEKRLKSAGKRKDVRDYVKRGIW